MVGDTSHFSLNVEKAHWCFHFPLTVSSSLRAYRAFFKLIHFFIGREQLKWLSIRSITEQRDNKKNNHKTKTKKRVSVNRSWYNIHCKCPVQYFQRPWADARLSFILVAQNFRAALVHLLWDSFTLHRSHFFALQYLHSARPTGTVPYNLLVTEQRDKNK